MLADDIVDGCFCVKMQTKEDDKVIYVTSFSGAGLEVYTNSLCELFVKIPGNDRFVRLTREGNEIRVGDTNG